MKKPIVLMILDGWGYAKDGPNNAISLANTSNFDSYLKKYPRSFLKPSGLAVGLPDGVMGNSEVGHLNIGAGRVVYQDLTKINKSIKDGDFFKNTVLLDAIAKSKKTGKLHLMGLLSDAGVHSDISHLKALIEMAKKEGVKDLIVHPIMDGRDTDPNSGVGYVKQLEEIFKTIGLGRIGTMSGRFYAMDRDNRWERVEKAYNNMIDTGVIISQTPVEYIENSYKEKITDEFIEPVCFNKDAKLRDDDAVIFYNFRSDRAREITRAINEKNFDEFKRNKTVQLSTFVCFAEYKQGFPYPVAFPSTDLKNVLGEVISDNNLKQLRIAETEKYAHVTFFLNGGVETQFKGEDRILVDSPREVATYDLKPEMSAPEVTEKLLKALPDYDFIVINYANGDMVGHTGMMDAAIKAVETVDYQMGRVVKKVLELNGAVFLTADHGNVEKMRDAQNRPHTAHTVNPVNFILISNDKKTISLQDGKLSDIMPTILSYMNINKPKEVSGDNLLQRL